MGEAQQSLSRAVFSRRTMIGVSSMRGFFGYWFAVLKLTQAQAFAVFYRFVRYVGTRGDDDV
jgi:hypothetical protein